MTDETRTNETRNETKTARGVVARGRSIDVPMAGKRVTVGTTDDNKPATRLPTRRAGPGEEVELPIEEIRRLRQAGYLVDPDRAAPAAGEGPMFGGEAPGQVGPA